jgi:hypothetical protein
MNSVRKICGYGEQEYLTQKGLVAHYFKENGRLCLIWTRLSGFLGFATGQPRRWASKLSLLSLPGSTQNLAERKQWQQRAVRSIQKIGERLYHEREQQPGNWNNCSAPWNIQSAVCISAQFCSGVYVCARDARAEIEFNCS